MYCKHTGVCLKVMPHFGATITQSLVLPRYGSAKSPKAADTFERRLDSAGACAVGFNIW